MTSDETTGSPSPPGVRYTGATSIEIDWESFRAAAKRTFMGVRSGSNRGADALAAHPCGAFARYSIRTT